MILGTAGLTAALCIDKLLTAGLAPNSQVLVTGATGGVGVVAVALLHALGHCVTAVSGKSQALDWLKALGADAVIGREGLSEASPKPLLKPIWHAAVDSVGGEVLGNILKSVHHSGFVACCGLAGGDRFQGTVMPFILRGVSLLGVDSVEITTARKAQIWQKLATDWSAIIPTLLANDAVEEIALARCADYLPRFLNGTVQGRIVVNCR
jgi:alcohol dehydrogenase